MTTGIAPEIGQSSADSASVPLDEIRTLVDERVRYEGWLEALDARRAVTPAHVLERVRQDYAGRLARVADRLATHAAPLRAHEQQLAERHHSVEQRLGDERDALAEVELRTLVGEYAPEEGEQRRAGAQQTIASLEHDLGGAAAALADVRGLAARVAPAAPPTAPTSTASEMPVGAPAAEPGAPPEAQPAQGESSGSQAADPAAPAPNGRDQGGSFESGAFDHGAVDAARVALGDRETSLTPAFSDAIRSNSAAYTIGGGRPQPAEPAATGQEKTLRCQDCGAFNYPTEWYCEKCGGELAAL